MCWEFKVEVNVGKFQVVYKEIIKWFVQNVEYIYKKQMGGLGQFVKVIINFELFIGEEGVIYEFESKVIGGCILWEYILLVDVGVQDVMQYGVLVGYLLVNLKVMLFDGVYYEVDFLEMVFKIVGLQVFKKVVVFVQLVILELIMVVEVIIFEDYMGDVIGDLNFCCGQIQVMEEWVGVCVVRVYVLLLEMFGYVGDFWFKI